jgi:hypothetical protein
MRPLVCIALLASTAAAEPTFRDGIRADAHANRAWAAPTALTPPAGTFAIVDYELVLGGIIFAPTDRIEVGLLTIPPIDGFLFAWAHAKFRVLDINYFHAALRVDGLITNETEDPAGAASVAITMCIDPACHSHLGAMFVAARFDEETGIGGALSSVFSISEHMKIMFELDAGYSPTERDTFDKVEPLLVWYGLRLTSKKVGFDLGFAKPICDDCDDEDLDTGYPFLAFTYRFTRD